MQETDNEIRRKILDILYQAKRDEPDDGGVHRKVLLEELRISGNTLDFSISYLVEKKLIEKERYTGESPYFDIVRITCLGVDCVESQKTKMNVSPKAFNIQIITGDVTGVISQGNKASIKSEITVNKDAKKDFISGEETKKAENSIVEIEQEILNSNSSVTKIALKCLDIAKTLDMLEDIKWLEFEINGYPEEKGKYLGEILDVMNEPDSPLLKKALIRQVTARIYVEIPQKPVETISFPIIVTHPILEIEEWTIKMKGKIGRITSKIPAAYLPGAVEILHRPPNELVPFEISQRDYEAILTKIKQELLKFVLRAKERIGNA